VGKQEGLSFAIVSKNTDDVTKAKIEMELKFEDLDGNIYRQKIENLGEGIIVNPAQTKEGIIYAF